MTPWTRAGVTRPLRAGGDIPIVAHKKSNCRWLVTMEAEDFFRLYQSYYTDMQLAKDGKG